jgi:hypothetical protein
MVNVSIKTILMHGILLGCLSTISNNWAMEKTELITLQPISLYMKDRNKHSLIRENGKLSREIYLLINKNRLKIENKDDAQQIPINNIFVSYIWRNSSHEDNIVTPGQYTFDKNNMCFRFSLLEEQTSLPIIMSNNQHKNLRKMQLDTQGKIVAIAGNQIHFIYDDRHTGDETEFTADFVNTWNDFDDSFSDEKDSVSGEIPPSETSAEKLTENEGLKKKITKKQEIRHIPTTGLYQYSPFHEQYRLLNKEGFLTDNIQPLEATLRGIIIKNENNTFDFQITAEQIKEVWTNTSKDLISIQITAEQFKILEQNQRANNPEKKTFVMVNDTNQAFVIDGIIKKSYFTKRNCALVTTALGLIAVVIYAMQKYNIRFSDLKISELFKNISLSSTTTA